MPQFKINAKLATLLLAILVLAVGHSGPAAAQACAPNTCCATNPTTGAPACGAAAGNPLNVMSGNKFQREEDMPALPGVLGLELVRYYNSEASLSGERGILGRGWRLSYEAELVVQPGGNSITVYQGDGTQSRYFKSLVQPEPDTTLYNGNQPGQGSLRAKRAASGSTQGTEYILSPAGQGSGNRQTFNAQGKLIQITAPTGEYVSLQRDVAGFLLRVTDPQGRYLALRHLPAHEARAGDKFRGVQHIDSPVGRFGYEYGSPAPQGSTVEPRELLANLVKVSLPTHYDPSAPANIAGGSADRGTSSSSISKTYHYEDPRRPTLLTGISVQGQGSDGRAMSERMVTWGYDARGRANLSVKGRYDPKQAGPEQVSLVFHHKASDGSGITILTNSLGQTTRYSYAQIAGRPQLLEVRGAGCATCGAVNVRYRYDSRGRQTHELKLDSSGQAIAGHVTEYDGVDRPIRVSALSYRNGKPGALLLQVRYEYGADPHNRQPLFIARPSVVAGKEHTLRIAYNDKGQPTQVTESGYEPLEQKPITRTTGYTHAPINNRSVLTRIDGPLPNGPKDSPADSDVTQIAWDQAGSFITGIEEPGSRVAGLQYDGTGRIAEVKSGAGAVTRFEYTYLGQPQRISTRAPGRQRAWVQVFQYDAQGRLTGSGEQRGEHANASYRARFSQGFDVADRLHWRASSLGILEQHRYDTEGRLLRSGRYSNTMAQTLDYEFDPQGRLRGMRDASGADYRFSYTARGSIARVTDQMGVVWSSSAERSRQPRAAKPRQLLDDFGRVVATIDPDSGRTVRQYDAAGRMVASRDAIGNHARYDYDPQGRIMRQTITDVQTGKESHTRWHYQGAHLVWLEHPGQSERYTYDGHGLRIGKTITLDTAAGVRGSTTRYAYDAGGRPQTIGQRTYTWDALGRLLQIKSGDKTLATYGYNHRGERIGKTTAEGSTAYLYDDKQLTAELNGQGLITRQYIYLADAPIAAIDTPQGLPLADEDSWRTVLHDLHTIVASAFTTDDTIVWLHPNHLGAPEAVTDANGRLVWQASYAPFGQVRIKSEKFALNIRLPGQYEDAESGLYYNRQRYYDPQHGQYLTPDPLGTPDGPNRYAYVRHNPLRYVDPDGLVLFAFDGTGNDESDPMTLSNVVAFRDLYLSDNKRVNYITGVGTVHRDPTYGDISAPFLDSGGNFSGRTRIARMVQYFDSEAESATDDDAAMDVDIIGFSRGAAQARDFASRIVNSMSNGYYKYTVTSQDGQEETRCQKVSLRFLGLFDTVLSTDLGSGEAYNLAIPAQFAYVAQAVALNEHRGSGLLYRPPGAVGAFPLESILQGPFSSAPVAGQTRIERGFLGSHSDIGGGFAQGDLARISLDWMVSQARLAGVSMNDAPATIIANPVLHDKSNAMRYGEPRANSEDRTVRYASGSSTTQRNMIFAEGMTYADTQENNLINYGARYEEDNVTGTVDAQQYINWLNAHGYNIKLGVQ